MEAAIKHNKKVAIMPCGFKFFNNAVFRSKVIVEFGKPYYASEEMIEQYRSGDRRTSIGKFLSDVETRVRSLIFLAPTCKDVCAII